MRVPLSWLREYVDFDLSTDALADQLTMRGLEVSGIEVTGADWTDVAGPCHRTPPAAVAPTTSPSASSCRWRWSDRC